jgi:hypothetical protein
VQHSLQTPSLHAIPAAEVSKRKASSVVGVVKEKPERRLVKLSAKPASAKVERKPKGQWKGINLQTKEYKQRDEGTKGKLAIVVNQETKDLPTENENSSLINQISSIVSDLCLLSRIVQRSIFVNYYKPSFQIALGTFLRREFHLILLLNYK